MSAAGTPGDHVPHSPRRARWTLALLTLLYVFYLLDRNTLIISQELIKRDFSLSDTQIGFLLGSAYGISYGIAGLPMGRLVDGTSRRNLLVIILSCWSGLTALSSIATSFGQLVGIRIAVAATEAGGAPASLSLLSDLFSQRQRATVASIFFTGSGIGLCLSFFLGGWIAGELGWRALFLIFGLPGIALALLIALTVVEPVRQQPQEKDASIATMWRGVAETLMSPVLRWTYVGATLYCLSTAAVLSWIVAFLMRTHGFSVTEAGTVLAGTIGLGSILGGVLIGLIADRAAARHRGGALRVVASAAMVNMTAGWLALTSESPAVIIAALAVFGSTVFAYSGPSNAVISLFAPPHARGVGFALFSLAANFFGAGLGPILAGGLSDVWPASQALGWVLSLLLMLNVPAAIAYLRAARAADRMR